MRKNIKIDDLDMSFRSFNRNMLNIGCSVDSRYIVNMHNIFTHTLTKRWRHNILISTIKPSFTSTRYVGNPGCGDVQAQ